MGSCLGSCFGKDSERASAGSRERLYPSTVEPPSRRLPRNEVVPKPRSPVVECRLFDDPNPSECPFCGEPNADKSNMIICTSPTIPYDMFQKLMVRGWWRTGNVIFIPRHDIICCPSYAIRVPVAEYRLTKKHRKILNNWKAFLINGDPRWENRVQNEAEPSSPTHNTQPLPPETTAVLQDNRCIPVTMETYVTMETNDSVSNGNEGVVHSGPIDSSLDDSVNRQAAVPRKPVKKQVRNGVGPDPNKPPCRKAKEIRAERRWNKANKEPTNVANYGATNEQRDKKATPSNARPDSDLVEVIKKHKIKLDSCRHKHRLEIKLIPNDDPEMLSSLQEFYDLYIRFQNAVHPGQSKFETLDALHWGFIESPLEPQHSTRPRDPNNTGPLGTHHMRYYLDGKLTMVSVLDILPEYLVSIYFIYDPSIRFLQPGIYTCLREMELMLELQQSRPGLRYYNLGFYNDFSPKINYKRQFKPTEILCPITGTYVPLERVIPLLKQNRYCRFADEDIVPDDRTIVTDRDIGNLRVRSFPSSGNYVCYHQIQDGRLKGVMEPVLKRYTQQMGADVAREMLLTI